MVTSIVPGATSANPLGVDARFARQQPNGAARGAEAAVLGDRVEVSGASIAAARESVRDGINQVHQALAVGHDAQAMLVAARGAASQADLDAILGAYQQRVDGAIAQGATLVAGQPLQIYAEPGGAPVTIAGVDLRLRTDPAATEVISLSSEAKLDDQATGQAVQRSLEALQDAMNRLIDSARALEAHQGFLGAAEGALGVRNDLDAEGARLLALQVRQGLQSVGSAPIANAEPQAVLTLFRA